MTRLAFLLVLGLAGAVFHLKHEVMALASKHRDIRNQTLKVEEDLHVLKAEWAHLNHPNRLKVLVNKYLPVMEPIKRSVSIKNLSFHHQGQQKAQAQQKNQAQEKVSDQKSLNNLLEGVKP